MKSIPVSNTDLRALKLVDDSKDEELSPPLPRKDGYLGLRNHFHQYFRLGKLAAKRLILSKY